jgi:serine phosphatase RsbU (regulator of sigma subunit)
MKSISKYILIILFLTFLVSTSKINSQNSKIDSLLEVNKKLKDSDTIKVLNFLKITQEYRQKQDITNAIKFAKEAEALFPKSKNKSLFAKTNYLLGVTHYHNTQYKEALAYMLKAQSLYEEQKDKAKVANTYNVIALIYQDQTFYAQAQEYHLKCLKMREELNDSGNLGGSYSNIGLNYYNIAKQKKEDNYESQNIKDAISNLKRAYELGVKFGNMEVQANSLGNLSNIMNDLTKYDEALKYANQALKIYQETGDAYQESVSLIDIGSIHLAQKKHKEAIPYFEKSLQFGIENNDREIQHYCYANLVSCYEKIGDFTKAFKYQKEMIAVKDSLFNSENSKQINDMQIKYDTEKKESENKLLQVENELSTKTLKSQKIVIYLIVGGLLLTIILAFFIFKGLKKQRQANQIISKQKQEVELQRDLIDQQKHIVEEHQKEILDSIHYAKRIQNTIIAHKDFIDENIENNFVYFNPKDIVSGDFYWATKKENYFFLAACDSTGHGVPGAFMSLLNIGFLSEAINEKDIIEPSKIFDYTRERLISSISKDGQKDGFDGILIRINNITKEIIYVAANNSPVIVSENQLIDLEVDKMPVGHGERKEHFRQHKLEYKSGDILYLYTDGYADQFGGPKGKKFKYKPLNEMLIKISTKPLSEQSEILSNRFNDWRGSLEQVDDVLIIGIKL